MKTLAVPYVGWRMLFTASPQARALVVPCLLTVGTVVAAAGLLELLNGSNLFIHEFVNPRLAAWAHTYTRQGVVRISSSFWSAHSFGHIPSTPNRPCPHRDTASSASRAGRTATGRAFGTLAWSVARYDTPHTARHRTSLRQDHPKGPAHCWFRSRCRMPDRFCRSH